MYCADYMLTFNYAFNYAFNYIETYILKNLWYHECFLRRFTHFLDIIYESHNSKFSSIVYWYNNIRLLKQLYYGRYYSKLLFRIILLIWNSCLLFIWVNAWVVEGNGLQNHYYTSCVRITLYPLIKNISVVYST